MDEVSRYAGLGNNFPLYVEYWRQFVFSGVDVDIKIMVWENRLRYAHAWTF
jgi:hypothetical protein